jgi:hypothetical protein
MSPPRFTPPMVACCRDNTAWNTTCTGISGGDVTKPAPAGSSSEPDPADND